MLEARTTTGGAAAIAPVETELGRRVAAFARQVGIGKNFADRVPRAHITDRIRACRFTNRRLVHKNHIAKLLRTQQTIKRTGRVGSPTKVPHQCRCQHILDQRGLARSADTGNTHQTLQRNFDRHVFQVVFAHPLQNQAWRIPGHQAFETHSNLPAAAQVGPRQGIGLAQILRAAIKHNLPAAFARPWPHVYHAVGGQHHRRIVLHHHQRIAGVAQSQHGPCNAMHVARVQANAGLVQHKQRVDQRGAQRSSEVDTLHLTARQGAALAVQAQVTNAHVAQVFEARGDFFKQQLQRLVLAIGTGTGTRLTGPYRHRIKKPPQPVYRQQHQVMQTQPRQRFQLRAVPPRTLWHKTFARRHGQVGVYLAAYSPEQALQLQSRARAGRARRITTVLGQQHTNVHLVGLGLQVLEEALDAEPVLVPFAVPVGRAVDDPLLVLGFQFVPGCVTRNACVFGMAHQVVLGFLPGRRLHGFDGTGAQREFVIRDHQVVVHTNHTAKAATAFARANGRVKRERRRDRVGVAQVTVRAMQAGGEFPDARLGFRQYVHSDTPAATLECGLNRFQHTRTFGAGQAKPVGNYVEHLAFARAGGFVVALDGGLFCRLAAGRGFCRVGRYLNLALGLHLGVAADRQPLRDLVRRGVHRQFHRKGNHQARVFGTRECNHLRINSLWRVVAHRLRRIAVEKLASAGEQQLEVIVEFGHGAHGGSR